MSYSTALISALMFFAGVGVPIMAAMNASLGMRIASPIAAVFILCLTATIISGLLLLISKPPTLGFMLDAPKQLYTSGLLFLFYILSVTIIAPKLGLANAILLVLFGQIVSAVAIDHFGLFQVKQVQLTAQRVMGLGMMIVGVLLARKDIVYLQ